MRRWCCSWKRCAALAIVLVTFVVLMSGVARAQQGPEPRFTVMTYPAGWNLLAFGDSMGRVLPIEFAGPLYTFQPNDQDYQTTDSEHLQAGYGYWVYLADAIVVPVEVPSQSSYSVNVPAGQCVMVGNPSMTNSALVTGADRVYEFSPRVNSYFTTKILGIGRGAWVCADAGDSTVTLSTIAPPTLPVTPKSLNNNGQVHFVVYNASFAPMSYAIRQIDATGEAGEGRASGVVLGCDACPNPATSQGQVEPLCNSNLTPQLEFDLPAGFYQVHAQFDAADPPDAIANVTGPADTYISICFYSKGF